MCVTAIHPSSAAQTVSCGGLCLCTLSFLRSLSGYGLVPTSLFTLLFTLSVLSMITHIIHYIYKGGSYGNHIPSYATY